MRILLALAVLVAAGMCCAPAAEQDAASVAFFEKQIRPLLIEHCLSCHSQASKKQRGGLHLDSREAMLKGGETGPAIVPGKPLESLLIQAVHAKKGELQMPPKEKLRPQQIAALEEWVRRGAPYPAAKAATSPTDPTSAVARQFWSFQPLRTIPPPHVQNTEWPQRPIDAFLLAEMEKRKLSHSTSADRRVLIRRASFDLLGLPPTPEEVEAFLQDDRPRRLRPAHRPASGLSPLRRTLGAHWLDLARYCDVPETWMTPRGQAWPYRDWVVQALNRDMPYDKFVPQQLAADLLPSPIRKTGPHSGFSGISPAYWKELNWIRTSSSPSLRTSGKSESTRGSTFLGLTAACAVATITSTIQSAQPTTTPWQG